MSDFRNILAEPIPIRRESPDELDPMLSLCEISTLHLFDLAVICSEYVDREQDLLWPNKDGPQGTLMLESLAATLSNTLLGVRQLVLMGLDAQARVLLRHFVEMADLTIAVSYDYGCFTNYAGSSVDPDRDRKHWGKHLRPEKIRQIVSRLERGVGLSQEHLVIAKDIRLDMYRWLSLYSHANLLGRAISSLAVSNVSGRLIPKVGDQLDQMSRVTMSKAAFYSWLSNIELAWLSHHQHDWTRLVNKENASKLGWFHYRSEVIKHFALLHHDAMDAAITET